MGDVGTLLKSHARPAITRLGLLCASAGGGPPSRVSKEILSQRTADYENWVEAFARNHHTPIAWAEKGVRKEDHVLPWQRRITKNNAYRRTPRTG